MYTRLCSDVATGLVTSDPLVLRSSLPFPRCYLPVGALRRDPETTGSLIRSSAGVNMAVKAEDSDIHRLISIGKPTGHPNFSSVYFWVWFGGS